MVIDFSKVDLNNPVFVLENMDETPIGVLGFAHNVSTELNYNEVSTLEFICPKQANGIDVPYYDDLDIMKVVLWKDVGRFLIVDINENNEGFSFKTCKCYSLEFSFTYKTFYLANSTYCLYNPTISGTIMDFVLDEMPEWSVGYCSSDLLTKYRTFDTTTGTNVYNFLKDIQKKYSCIFDFNTLNKIINIVSVNEVIPTQPIYLSLNNLLKSVEVNQKLDDIFTVVSVYGANNLSINSCNPMGSKLYDLSYYTTEKFMSPTLIQKYNDWKAHYETSKTNYSLLNIQHALQTSRKITENAKLNTLKGELSALTAVQSTLISAIAGGDSSQQTALTAKNAEIADKKTEIATQEALIASIQTEIDNLTLGLQAIVDSVQFSNFFTPAELNVLQRFFKEDTLSDNSFVASTTTSYNDTDSSNAIVGLNISLTDAIVTEITSVSNKTIYSVVGGYLRTLSTPILNANVIRMTLERNTLTNSFILSAYLSSGDFNDTHFSTACVSITGNCFDITFTSSSLSFSVTGNLYFTQNALSAYKNNSVAQDLMEYGESCLKSLSRPSYEFEIESANFTSLSEFESFKNKLGLGKKVYIDLDNGMGILEPFVISIKIDFDTPNNFKLIFSDKYCQSGVFSLTSLLEESINMGSKLSLNQFLYSSFIDSGAETALSDLQKNALDLSKKAILSASGLAPTIDDSGLHMRKLNSLGTGYETEEICMINNQICFTKDNFNTVSLALGKINFNGTNLYGLIADALVGKIIAGNSLVIESAKKSGGQSVFKIDGDGAALHNAKFDLVTSNSHILLDPTLGFGIGTYPIASGGVWNTNNAKFYIDTSGNVVFKGTLSGANGYFSGDVYAENLFLGSSQTNVLNGLNQIIGQALDLKNLSVTTYNGKNSLIIDNYGTIVIGDGTTAITVYNGAVTFGSGVYLNWNNISGKPNVATQDMINSIVNGTYIGGTFINGSLIYAPTLIGATIFWGDQGVYGSLTRSQGFDGVYTTNVVKLFSASSIVLESVQNIRLTAQKMWFDVDANYINIEYNGQFCSLPNLIQTLTPTAVFA